MPLPNPPTFSQTVISNWEREGRDGTPVVLPRKRADKLCPSTPPRKRSLYGAAIKRFLPSLTFVHLAPFPPISSFFPSFPPFPPLAGLFSFNVYNDLANLPRDLSTLPPPLTFWKSLFNVIFLCPPCSTLFFFFYWRDGDGEGWR